MNKTTCLPSAACTSIDIGCCELAVGLLVGTRVMVRVRVVPSSIVLLIRKHPVDFAGMAAETSES